MTPPACLSGLAVVFRRLGPYHWARLRAASERQALLAIELTADTTEYGWDRLTDEPPFRRVTLFPAGASRQASAGELRRRIASALNRHRPKAVAIPGWSDRGALAALGWCLSNRTPAILMSESTAWDEPRTGWKEWVKRRIVAMCSAGLVGGKPHVDYLAALGMPRDRIFTGYDVVDVEYFARKTEEVSRQRSEVRGKHGLPDRYFLASARFIEKKNLSRLIHAYARYRKLATDLRSPPSDLWHLVLLGDGPLKPDLGRLISDLGLRDFVLLPGFQQYPTLPFYYGLAGAFIHASTTEQWGLVVNEAMASGLPVLVSQRCGCAPDLVVEGRNGFTFDPLNVEQLASLMQRLSSGGCDRAAWGQASRDIIAPWAPEAFARGLLEAVQASLSGAPPRASLLNRLLLCVLWLR